MKAWSDWLPDLMPHVNGCPDVVAEHELRRAAQAFFSRTRAWAVLLPSKPVTTGQADVSVEPDDDTIDVVRVEAAFLDGRHLDKVTADTIQSASHDQWTEHKGTPSAFTQLTPGFVRLYPTPESDSTTGLSISATVRPSDTSNGLPDDIAHRFWDVIHVGAKARLMIYPGKPWSNPALAATYGQAFAAMSDEAAAASARAYVNARLPAKVKWC